MPRTLLTDDVINRLCPEYQPLGNPNAYFDNVGGMVRSEGIKPTPVRPPARPARVNYLSNNSGISLTTIRANVLGTQEIAQEVVDDLRVVQLLTAPPIEPNMLEVLPAAPFRMFQEEELEEKDADFLTAIEQSLEEQKGDIPYVEPVALPRTQIEEGDIDPQTQMARETALLERMKEKGIPTPVERAAAEKQSLKEQMARETALLERRKERAAAEKQSSKEQMVREVALLERLKKKGIPTPRERAETTAILPPSQMVRQQSEESLRKEARVAEARKQLAVAVSGLQQETRSLFFAVEKEARSPRSAFLAGEGRTRELTRKEKNEAVRKGLIERKGLRGSFDPFTTELR